MGSLCCVAARPHRSNAASRDWSIGPKEPYWRTNTSFSPPSRWDFRFQSEAPSFGSQDGIQLYESSVSSNSRGSRRWFRGSNLTNHQLLIPNGPGPGPGPGPYLSSPSDISPTQQWTPPVIQEIITDDYSSSRREVVMRPVPFLPTMEGPSAATDSGGSMSSRSDSSDSESMVKSHNPHRNRRCFMSKAVHPLSFPPEPLDKEVIRTSPAALQEPNATLHSEGYHLRSTSGSFDLSEVPESFEYDPFQQVHNPGNHFKCELCERFLSQRSPWGSHRIVKSGDMPVSGVLSCRHVFHAECLDQTTPKTHKNDPSCPICAKHEEENSFDQRIFSKLKSGFSLHKPFCEDKSSKLWGCVQAKDCVGAALHTPPRNTLLSQSRSRFGRNLYLKGNPAREFPVKLGKGSSFSPLLVKSSDSGTPG